MKKLHRNIASGLVMVVATFAFQALCSPKAEALLNLVPDPGAGIPYQERDAARSCDARAESPAFNYWFSKGGDSSEYAGSFNADSTTPYIDVRFNWGGTVCKSNSSVTNSYLAITGYSPGSFGTNPGYALDYTSTGGPGTYDFPGTFRLVQADFKFAPPGGFTGSGQHILSFNVKRINRFANGTLLCVNPGSRNPVNILDFGACGDLEISTSIWIDYTPQPAPTVVITENACTGINVSSTGNRIDIFGPSGFLYRAVGDASGTSGTFVFRGVVPSGTTVDVYGASDSGAATVGDTLRRYTWNLDPNCEADFTVQTIASVDGVDDENPTTANFSSRATLSSGPASVNGISVTYSYFIRRGSPVTIEGRTISPIALTASSPPYELRGADLTGYNLVPGDEVCAQIQATPGSGRVRNGVIISSGPASAPDIQCVRIVNKPYVTLFGSDVKVGGGAEGTLDCNSKVSGIGLFNKGTSQGSSAQLAIFALGVVNGLVGTAYAVPPPGNPEIDMLTAPDFSNYDSCTHDFYSDREDTTPWSGSIIAGTPDNKYFVNGNVTLTAGSLEVGNNQKAFIYVDGDVTINNDITLLQGVWRDRSEIPSFYVIATGDILISNNVKRLGGVYISQRGGSIITCSQAVTAQGATYVANPNAMYRNCGNQLVVDGAFIANKVVLNRAYGSLRDDTPTESPYGASNKICNTSAIGFGSSSVCAAEVFRYNPSLYLAESPRAKRDSTNTNDNAESITNLPPIL